MNEGQRFTFKKDERVTGVKRIEHLFAQGRSFISYPLRVVFVEQTMQDDSSRRVSVFVSVPKKKLKSAVDRNRMKRLIRETYRLNKHSFDTASLKEGQRIDVAFVYLKDELSDYAVVEKGMRKALKEMALQLKGEEKC